MYASKIQERLTVELRTKDLPFTIIADESTDPHSNQEISSLYLRFVDQSSPNDPHVKEYPINFMHLDRGIAQTFPAVVQFIITKKSVAISLLDSLSIQMQDRFSDEDHHARHLFYLVPSIIVNNTRELSEATDGMLFWENDLPFPKSLGNELRRLQIMWQAAEKELPSTTIFYSHLARVTRMLFQTSIVFFSLHAPYQSVLRKLSSPFAHEMDQDVHQINDMRRALFRCRHYCCALPREIRGRRDMRGL